VVGFGKKKLKKKEGRTRLSQNKKEKSNHAIHLSKHCNSNQGKISGHPTTYIPNYCSHGGWFTLALNISWKWPSISALIYLPLPIRLFFAI
jgi:hypothetical protein